MGSVRGTGNIFGAAAKYFGGSMPSKKEVPVKKKNNLLRTSNNVLENEKAEECVSVCEYTGI